MVDYYMQEMENAVDFGVGRSKYFLSRGMACLECLCRPTHVDKC